MNSFECRLPYIILDIKDFLQFILLTNSFTQIYFTLKSVFLLNDCHVVFLTFIFYIRQHNNLWKKTFKNIHQLSCFVGHPVGKSRDGLITSLFVFYDFRKIV